MKIDFTKTITSVDIEAQALLERSNKIKSECRGLILSVASETTQMNIAHAGVIFTSLVVNGSTKEDALLISGLSEGDLENSVKWKKWVSDMQAESRRAIESKTDPNWPDVPEGIYEFASRF